MTLTSKHQQLAALRPLSPESVASPWRRFATAKPINFPTSVN
jgi:hypothetical protein